MKTKKLIKRIENEIANDNAIDAGTLYGNYGDITEISYVIFDKKMYRVEKTETQVGYDNEGEKMYEDSTRITEIITTAEKEEIIESLSK